MCEHVRTVSADRGENCRECGVFVLQSRTGGRVVALKPESQCFKADVAPQDQLSKFLHDEKKKSPLAFDLSPEMAAA